MRVICLSLAFCLFSANVFAQQWSDLQLTLTIDGTAPAPKKIDPSKDPLCANYTIMSEDLLVNPANKGIKNVMVFVDAPTSKLEKKEIHPDLAAVPAGKVVLDNNQCTFVPHAILVRAGQTIDVKNSDKASHNANFGFFKNASWNSMITPGQSRELKTLDGVEEAGVVRVDCNIHPWMNARLLILDHPYMALSDDKGVVKIEKLPAGRELTIRILHESFEGSLTELDVGGKKQALTRGSRWALTLKPGMNDLGTAKIPASKFKVP